MQSNISIIYDGRQYVGWDFSDLPFGAAKLAACKIIDQAADNARLTVLGDPMRAVEYRLVESDARAFKAASYQGDVPLSVQSWVDAAELTPELATKNILEQADLWMDVLLTLRAIRLRAKQKIQKAVMHDSVEEIVNHAINEIRESIAGVGNA